MSVVGHRTSDRRAIGILTLLMLVIALPFVRRAYFVDDYYFVTMAKGILQHPLRPYDFVSDDAGIGNVAWERGQRPRMVNPPLFHYFLAAVIALWGGAVWKLRSASLLFTLVSLYATYFLGKRFVKNSLAAACLLAITPAFWLTSYSLLIDNALLAFFLTSLWCFIEGQERKKISWLLLSGVLMGCALLTKYTGFLIFPLILAWQLGYGSKSSWWGVGIAFSVCGFLFLLWGVWGILTYGQMHFFATLPRGFHSISSMGLISLTLLFVGTFFRLRMHPYKKALVFSWLCWLPGVLIIWYAFLKMPSLSEWIQTFYLDKFIAVASFLGGCTVFLFFTPWLLFKRKRQVWGAMGLFLTALFFIFHSHQGGFDVIQSATLIFFIGATTAFLILLSLGIPSQKGSHIPILGIWLVLGLLELILVMPWTAGRYLLLILPPVCWLFRMMIEEMGRFRLWKWVWGTTAIVGLTLAYIDFAQAGVIVPLSRLLNENQSQFQKLAPRPPHHWYFLADTFDGSQPYIVRQGWENVFPFQHFESGSLFLRSFYRKSSWWRIPDPERFMPIMAWEFNSWIPLRVMDVPASAGFYASCWGILPYAITTHPLEFFELDRVK